MMCYTKLLNKYLSHTKLFFRSRRLKGKSDQPEPSCPDIERVDKLTILGVDVNSKLTAADHVSSCFLLQSAVRPQGKS